MKRELVYITLSGFAAGALYTILGDDWSNPSEPIIALLIGTIGGFLSGLIETRIFAREKWRLPFIVLIIVRTITYFVMLCFLVVPIKVRVESWFLGSSMRTYFWSDEFQYFLWLGEFRYIMAYSFFIIALIIFFRQLSRHIGPGVLMSLIRGKYHNPRKEQRIFLLIDLKSSTSIAESMDQLRYYNFLNQFFRDISVAALPFNAKVYRYVGDQVTFTWRTKNKQNFNNAVSAYFSMRGVIQSRREEYLNRYGLAPDFHGTANHGSVITGEIGDVRTQIVHQGPVLLEAGRMEKIRDIKYNGLCCSEAFLEPATRMGLNFREITKEVPGTRKLNVFEIFQPKIE